MTSGEPKPATAARMYDYYLGGTHNFAADREAAKAVAAMFPGTPVVARLNRAFLRRSVRYLTSVGVRQFLDVGSGIPTEGNVHEIADEGAPDSKVIYVDIDPVAVAESQEILEGNPRAIAVRGDAADPRGILSHPSVTGFLDFSRPVGLLLVAVLHFVTDDDEAHGCVRELMGAFAPGSHLVLSHGVGDPGVEVKTDDLDSLHALYQQQTSTQLRLRDQAEVTSFFDGLELAPPGVVWVPQWRPAAGDPLDFADDPRQSGMLAGVGRLG